MSNKVSNDLRAFAAAAKAGIRKTFSPELFKQHADLIERLVDKLKGLLAITVPPNDVSGKRMYDEAVAILRELESEPRLPDPPWRVYGIVGVEQGPIWIQQCGYLWITADNRTVAARHITIIDHPRNDPEAVEIVKKVKCEV